MESILDQLDDPLGSAVTLSKLMSANVDLMERYANAALTLRFLKMIKNLGYEGHVLRTGWFLMLELDDTKALKD